MKRPMKTIHISYGGPDRRIKDATGKVWRFEMPPQSGPAVQDARGELADQQPGERSPFWAAVTLWAKQGAVIGPDGLCTWKPEPEPTLVHLGGRNYAIAGSGPAGWYAVVVCRDENEGMFPSASFWNGSSWGEDQRPIVAFHGPHPSEEAAKDWAYEHDPEI